MPPRPRDHDDARVRDSLDAAIDAWAKAQTLTERPDDEQPAAAVVRTTSMTRRQGTTGTDCSGA